jgi:hypothetical protein
MYLLPRRLCLIQVIQQIIILVIVFLFYMLDESNGTDTIKGSDTLYRVLL